MSSSTHHNSPAESLVDKAGAAPDAQHDEHAQEHATHHAWNIPHEDFFDHTHVAATHAACKAGDPTLVAQLQSSMIKKLAPQLVSEGGIHTAYDEGVAQGRAYLNKVAWSCAMSMVALGPASHRSGHLDADQAEAGSYADPVANCHINESKQRIRAAIESLPPLHKEAIRLRYGHKHTLHEVADTLGVPRTTVSSWLIRARQIIDLHLAAQEQE